MIESTRQNFKPLIVGNWKMHQTLPDAKKLVGDLLDALGMPLNADLVVCPPFVVLSHLAEQLAGSVIALGAQNVHQEPFGAFTGEISAEMLQAVGVRYVIVGHSERRTYFNENDALVHQKILAALRASLIPIVCVGETLKERESGETHQVLERQLVGALNGLSQQQASQIVLAYEPVWAIGTGKTATPDMAQEAHHHLRTLLVRLFGQETAAQIKILYGGSMKPDNAKALLAMPDINGGLIGGASLKAADFLAIAQAC